jgi:hypothetical protein
MHAVGTYDLHNNPFRLLPLSHLAVGHPHTSGAVSA